MNNKALKIIVAVVLGLTFLTGCEPKITTVADDIQRNENDETEYITVQEIRIKDSDDSGLEEIGYCSLLIPANFVQSDEHDGMYVSSLYPLDSSNIYYTICDGESLGAVDKELTAENYERTIEEGFAITGEAVDLIIDSFTREEMEGIPCFKIRSHYSMGDKDVQQLVYIISATQTHVITYTQLSDDELMADFLTDEGNIRLVRERSQA